MSMNWLKRHDLIVFLILAFALSWSIWPLVLANPESTPLVPFGPIIAAFIVLALTRGWAGIRDLLRSIVRWRVGPGWYAVALLLPVGILLVALYLNALFGGPTPTAADFADWYTLPLLYLLTTLFFGPLFEEPGWRGFLLPRLQSKYTAVSQPDRRSHLGKLALAGAAQRSERPAASPSVLRLGAGAVGGVHVGLQRN